MKKERVEKERDHLSTQKKRREKRERIKVIKKKYNSVTVPSYIVATL